ncbi:hypothetical protein VTL71DRAFT_3254, partial [Oculimacula yallundae]
MASFSILHWLASQLTFAIGVLQFDWGMDANRSTNQVASWTSSGYSIFPAIISVVYGAILVTFYILYPVFKKFPKDSAALLVSS